jgi:hypothetical protein
LVWEIEGKAAELLVTTLLTVLHDISVWGNGGSANKFRKSQLRKISDLQNLLYLRTFHNCGDLRICDLRINFFADLRKSAKNVFEMFLFEFFKIKIRPNNPADDFYVQ